MGDMLGLGLGGSSGSTQKQLSSATATTSFSDIFGGRGTDLTQLVPIIMAGLAVVGVLVIAVFALKD